MADARTVSPGAENGGCLPPSPMLASTLAYVRERAVHGSRCSANPEIGCLCGFDAGDDRPFAWANARDLSVSDEEAAAFAAEMRTR